MRSNSKPCLRGVMGMARVRGFALLLSCVTLLGFFSLVGCDEQGRAHFAAGGSVRFASDNTPATFGDIEFRSEGEQVVVARGKIQKDGTFTVSAGSRRGTVAGWHTVVILQPVRSLGGGMKHSHGHDAHRKYGDHRTTDLRVEVTAETGIHGLDLVIEDLAK